MHRADYEKMRWRSTRRALLELDIVLSRFLDEGFDQLSEEDEQRFVTLLALEDHDLWALISGRQPCSDPQLASLLARIAKV